MSGLTRKQIYVDRNLSTILGISEGELVSYADIQKRLHKYIKDNDLRNPQRGASYSQPKSPEVSRTEVAKAEVRMKTCFYCGADIPSEATFCDICGLRQEAEYTRLHFNWTFPVPF